MKKEESNLNKVGEKNNKELASKKTSANKLVEKNMPSETEKKDKKSNRKVKDLSKSKKNAKEKHAKIDNSKAEDSSKIKKFKQPKKLRTVRQAPSLREYRKKIQEQKRQTKLYSKRILKGEIISTTGVKPDVSKYAIELVNVKKSYITGELETQVLKGINVKIEKGVFIVILGPSGSGKTTLLNIISGLDKASSGDVFALGYNLSLLRDVDLTKFRRDNVGFIFQQYNLLTNLTAKENAEVGENLSKEKNKDLTINDIFKTIGMADQMNKYPHQMSGGQQQRVSIARALAKNPGILFGDEPTGALDEEMGRKVLEILINVNKKYKTTVIVVTHNPNIADIADVVIHVRNGLIDQIKYNDTPKKPTEIEWS